MTLSIAVIGTGRIGKMHAELLHNQIDEANVAGVFDVMSESAAAVAESLGVRQYASATDIMVDPDVAAVAICTSTDTHVDLIEAAAAAGKAIFCEKPLSLNLEEVDRALTAVAQAGVPMQIGFNRRFDASHKAVADAVAARKVGDLHLVRITSRDPAPPPVEYIKVSGGIFLDMTIHDFDMARYVTRSEVIEVYAKGDVRVNPAIGAAGDLDTVVVILTHEDGTITTIDNSRQAVYGYDQRVEAFGAAGMVASDNPLITSTVLRTEQGLEGATLPYFFLDRYIPSYLEQWHAFCEAITTGSDVPVTGADGRAPLVIGLAAWKSIRERRPVPISEIR